MRKTIFAIAAMAALSGCTSFYLLDGKKYDSEQAFQQAVETNRQEALLSIQPLQEPLTKKRLIVALPSEQALYDENARRHQAAMGRAISGLEVDQNRNLSKANFKMNKVWFEAVQKRGIYPSMELRETNSLVNSLEPAPDYDVMYYTEPSVGTGQYFYASAKHGKQVFAYDRSKPGVNAQVQSFVEAVQAFAVRD